MIEFLIYLRGRYRIFWGLCPVCNSDAPGLDKCYFCKSFRGYRDKTGRKEWLLSWLDQNGKLAPWA